MRAIAGPGSGSGTFTDYDPVTNPDGTVITADWANDVQDELLGIQDDAGIAEAAGSNEYVLAAMKYNIIRLSKRTGELFSLDEYEAPAEFDKDNPEDYFPGLCLDAIDESTDIDDANWPDLGPHLRAKLLKHREGTASEKSQFDVTAWDITSNVATLTFASATAEQAILDDLLEDNTVHDSYGSWRAIKLPSAIGDIAAGTYAITAVDTVNREIEFAYTASDNSGSVTAVAEFPAHEVPGSSTTARVFQVSGRSIVSPNDSADEVVSGLRRRDQMQQITGSIDWVQFREDETNEQGAISYTSQGSGLQDGGQTAGRISFDSANSPNARTGDTTQPRAIGAHLYIWARRYVA